MNKNRFLTDEETIVVRALLEKANRPAPDLKKLKVEVLDDGGMGSLRFVASDTKKSAKRKEDIAAAVFTDSDGADVQLVLDIDYQGRLYELDGWKVDNSPRLRWPKEKEIRELVAQERGIH